VNSKRYLQGILSLERRTLTPEVAGSSPVAPASKLLQIAKFAIAGHWGIWSSLVTVFVAST
jgi:hypothetical protein